MLDIVPEIFILSSFFKIFFHFVLLLLLICFVCLFCFLVLHLQHMDVPRPRGWIRAAAASLHRSHSNARSGPHLPSTPYTTAHGNAQCLTHWVGPGIEPSSSWYSSGLLALSHNRNCPCWDFQRRWFPVLHSLVPYLSLYPEGTSNSPKTSNLTAPYR